MIINANVVHHISIVACGVVEKNVDFWEKMYDDPIRLLLIGPMEIIFFMIYVPAFIGIFDYIRNRSVKYRKPNICLLNQVRVFMFLSVIKLPLQSYLDKYRFKN